MPSKEAALALAAEACAADLPAKLIAGIEGLDFETRKDAAQVRTERGGGGGGRGRVRGARRPPLVLPPLSSPGPRRHLPHERDGETPGADYLEARHELLAQLLDG